jgi:hypothetical protein
MEQVLELNEVDVARMWDDFNGSGKSCCEFYSFIKQPIFKTKASRYFDDRQVDALVFPKGNRRLLQIFQELNALVMLESFLANRYEYQLDDHGLYGVEYFKDLFKEATKLLKRKRDDSPVRRTVQNHPGLVDALHVVISRVNLSLGSLVALHSTAKVLRPCFHSFTVQARGINSVDFKIPDQSSWQLLCYTLRHYCVPGLNQNFSYQGKLDRYTDFKLFLHSQPPAGKTFLWDPLAFRPGCEYFFYLQSSIERQSRVAFDYFTSTLGRPWHYGVPENGTSETVGDVLFANRDINTPQVVAAYKAAMEWKYEPAMALTDRLIASYDWVQEIFRMGCASLPIEIN